MSHVTEYAEAKIDLTLLKTSDKVAATLSSATSAAIIAFFAFFVFLFISLGSAWWIGQAFNNTVIGYFGVAIIFLLITIFAYAFRKTLFKSLVTNIFLKHLYD